MDIDFERKMQKIIDRIFSRTPFNFVPSVIAYLAEALKDEPRIKNMLLTASSSYNKSRLLTIDIEGLEHPSLITNFNEIKDGYFCDPRNKVIFQFDHLSRKVLLSTAWEADKDCEVWRKTVEDAFQCYVKKYFTDGCFGVFGSIDNGTIAVTICIIERIIRETNYSSCCWRSVWTLFIRPDATEIRMKGSVQVESSYTENGYSFMAVEETIDSVVPLLDKANTVSAVVEVVKQFEENCQKSVGDYFDETSDLMKSFRRRLPIIKRSFDWNFVIKPPSELSVNEILN